jgi:transcription antitermination factor NusG
MTHTTTPEWLLTRCRTGREIEAAEWLTARRVECLVILEKRYRKPPPKPRGKRDRSEPETYERPALPGYVLAKMFRNRVASLLWQSGLPPSLCWTPIYLDGRLVTVRERDIARLREMAERGEFDQTRPTMPGEITVREGDLVRVPSMIDVEANIISIAADGTAVLDFSLMGRYVAADARALEKVE